MGTGREMVRQFKTRKLQYLGHLIRHNTPQLQRIEVKMNEEDHVANHELPG